MGSRKIEKELFESKNKLNKFKNKYMWLIEFYKFFNLFSFIWVNEERLIKCGNRIIWIKKNEGMNNKV